MSDARLVLESISPVHIGSAERGLMEGEFIKSGKFCYVVDDEKLASALYHWKLNQTFSNEIANHQGRFRLYNFLKSHSKLSETDLSQIAGYRMELPSSQIVPHNPKPFIRDGRMRPYMPGTSIKGAIRTAILFSAVKRDPRGVDKLTEYVENRLDDIGRRSGSRRPSRWFIENQKKWFAQSFADDVLAHFSLTRGQRRYGPQTNVMRCLKVSDSLNQFNGLRLEQVMLMSVSNGRVYNKNNTIFYVECLSPEARVEFSLTIDQSILDIFRRASGNRVPFENEDDVFRMMEAFGKAQWEAERAYFDSLGGSQSISLNAIRAFYREDYRPSIRIGWGTGLLGTTIGLLLPDDLRKRVRNTLFVDRGDDEAPKSRRLTVFQSRDGIQVQGTLGWMRMGNSYG